MPTVLIISTTFPPFGNIGAVRLGCFAKYLNRSGWDVISVTLRHKSQREDASVVTNMPDLDTVYYHDTSRDTFAGKLIHTFGRRYNFEYLSYGLHPNTVLKSGQQALSEVFDRFKIDVVFASFVRPLAIRLASWAHRQFHVPWIADYRDTIEMIDLGWTYRIVCAAETLAVRSASHITTTTPTLARYLKHRHKQPITIIPNGYDPEDYQKLEPRQFDRFTVLYPGNILPGRNPLPVYRAVDQLIEEGSIPADRIQVLHYGAQNFRMNDEWLSNLLTEINNRAVIRFEDRIPRQDSLRAQFGAHVNLLLPGLVGNAAGNVPAKLYEYLRANRPILSVANLPQLEVRSILADCRESLVTSRVVKIKSFLQRHYQLWKQGKIVSLGRANCDIAPYSREMQAVHLAQVLRNVISQR